MADAGIAKRATIEIPVKVDLNQVKQLASQMKSLDKSISSITSTFSKSEDAFKRFNDSIKSTVDTLNDVSKSSTVFKDLNDNVSKNLDNMKHSMNLAGNASKRFSDKLIASTDAVNRNQDKFKLFTDSYGESIGKLDEAGRKAQDTNDRLKRSTDVLNHTHINPSTSGIDHYNSRIKMASDLSSKFSNIAWNMIGVTGALGASFYSGAKDAGELQQSYNYLTNLAVTSGEKRAEALRNVNAMQKENTDLSVKYGIAQTDLAKGDMELVHAGYTTNEALAAHKVMVQGAIASNQNYNDVMNNVTSTLDQYMLRTNNVNLMAQRTKTVMNDMAYAVDHSKFSFNEFGDAMRYVGATSHSTNQSLAGTMGAIAILSKNGQAASEAGTGLRKVLNSFGAAGKGMGGAQQRSVMKDLGLSDKDFYNSSGHLKQLSSLMQILQSRMNARHFTAGKEFTFMHQFFGTTGQETALILSKNIDQLKDLNNQVARAEKMTGGGYVGRLARSNMKTATNQVKVFQQAWKDFTIATATTILPAVTKLLKSLDKIIFRINKLGPTGKTITAWGAIFVAAIAPVSFAVGGLIKTFKFVTGSFKAFANFFKSPISNRLGASQSEYTSNTLKQNDELVKSYQQVAKARADAQGETYTPSSSTTLSNKGDLTRSSNIGNMTREDLRRSQRFSKVSQWQTRFASRFHGKSVTGTGLGKVGDAEHLFGDADALKDTASVAEHAGGTSRMLGLLDGVKGIGTKIPYLDLAIGATQLIGMNHKTIGKHVGSAVGMGAGTGVGSWAGGALGTLLDPFTFGLGTPIGTLAGGALGGWLGGKGGGKLGGMLQKYIPKHPFEKIAQGWSSMVNKIKHSSFGRSVGKMFSSISKYAKKSFGPVGKAWDSMNKSIGAFMKPLDKMFHDTFNSIGKSIGPTIKSVQNFVHTLHTTKSGQAVLKALSIGVKLSMLPLKGVFVAVGAAFKISMSLIKAVAKDVITYLKDSFTGLFQTIGGIFRTGADILTGRWSKMGQDLGSIGKGIEKMMIAPFDGAWQGIKSIGNDIKNFIENIWSSITHFGSKVANFARHPIKSVEHMFANGTQGIYPNGLPHATRAVVNDGTGPELIYFGNGYGMYRGRNIQTMLPQGSRVFNSEQTRQMVGVQHFANGTETHNIRVSNAPIDTKASQRELNLFRRKNINSWIKIGKDTSKNTDQISKNTGKSYKDTSDNVTSISNKMSDTLTKITSDMADSFNKILGTLPKDAQASMQSVVNALNQGISGIDNTLKQFGGNGEVLKPFHYATGSDGKLPNDQFAMVNDATSGPTQEAIVRNGSLFFPQHRNQLMRLNKGDAVLNGTQTQRLMSMVGHFAGGSGVSDDLLVKLAAKNQSNPNGAYQSEFASKVKPEGPSLEHGLVGSIASAIKSTGQQWTGAMWTVINNAIIGGGGSAPLLNAVRKYGTGHRYVWGADGPDAFDCSGLIKYAAEKAFGINLPHFSGSIMNDTSPIARSSIQAGDLVGNNDHIGVVVDKNHYFSAFNPSSKPNILETPLNSTYFPGTPRFGRLKGVPAGDTQSKSKGSFLQNLAKGELGKSALKWIQDKLAPLGVSGGAAGDSPLPTGSHKHWLAQAGISPSDYAAANYIISHESGWDPHATNPDGGAYGLPQALPASKMASAGSDWRSNPITQLRWMNSYVDGKYGGFKEAQAYWETHHNYANGGWANHPSTFGEIPGQPEIAINPKRASADRLIVEAIEARNRATGSNDLKSKLANLLAKPKNNSNRNVTFSPHIEININGENKNPRELAREIKNQVQQIFYQAGSGLGLNVK